MGIVQNFDVKSVGTLKYHSVYRVRIVPFMHVIVDSICVEVRRLTLDRFTGATLFKENQEQEKRTHYPHLRYN